MKKYVVRWGIIALALTMWTGAGFGLCVITGCATHLQSYKQQHEESQLYQMVP